MSTLTLHYKRIQQAVDGEFPFDGYLERDTKLEPFGPLFFRKIIGRLSEVLTQEPAIDRVVFQRTDRSGIMPFELGPATLLLLRTDPVEAYRTMNFNPEPSVMVTGSCDHGTFGRNLYVCVANGKIQDPLTGTWGPLAYGSKQGWMVRGPTNDSASWLPLVSLIDNAPAGVTSIERIVFAQWALVDVEELLKRQNTHFFLPRPWNINGPWITREELQHLYTKSKETAS